MNICRNFVFRKILEEVRPVELRREAFPALFCHVLWVGFTSFEIPCDVSDSFFALYRRHFFAFFFNLEKVRPRNF